MVTISDRLPAGEAAPHVTYFKPVRPSGRPLPEQDFSYQSELRRATMTGAKLGRQLGLNMMKMGAVAVLLDRGRGTAHSDQSGRTLVKLMTLPPLGMAVGGALGGGCYMAKRGAELAWTKAQAAAQSFWQPEPATTPPSMDDFAQTLTHRLEAELLYRKALGAGITKAGNSAPQDFDFHGSTQSHSI